MFEPRRVVDEMQYVIDKFGAKEIYFEDIQTFRKKAIKSMVLHKVIDPVLAWRFLKRNYLPIKNHGIGSALEPIKALIDL